MDRTATAAYRRRAAERRLTLDGGPLGTEPHDAPRDIADAFARLEAIRAAAVALAGGTMPSPSTPEQRRAWPAGRIEDRAAP